MFASTSASAASDFPPGLAVSLAVPGDRSRVDGVDGDTHGLQRHHHEVLVGLDGDCNLGRILDVLGEHREQLGEPLSVGADAPVPSNDAVIVDKSNVVVAFGPVDSAVHAHAPSDPRVVRTTRACASDLMDSAQGRDTSPAGCKLNAGRATVYL